MDIAEYVIGDLTYLNVLGTPILVTSSFEVAHDLLEKRSALYSSRPKFWMINSLLTISISCIPLNADIVHLGYAWVGTSYSCNTEKRGASIVKCSTKCSTLRESQPSEIYRSNTLSK